MVDIKKDYPNLLMICLGFLTYITSNFLKNNTSKIVGIVLSIAFFVIVLIDPLLFYSKKIFKNSIKLFGFILAGVIITIISIILFFLIGLGTAFYTSVAVFIVSYTLTGVSLFCKKNKRSVK